MDVIQGTYISASREIKGKSFKSTGSIVKWLSTIALHKICDAYDYHTVRKRDYRRTIDAIQEDSDEPDLLTLLVEGGMGPDENAEGREIVDEAISELPDDQREVILLRNFSAAPWREAGLALGGRSAHAAQELHRRALALLSLPLIATARLMEEAPAEAQAQVEMTTASTRDRRVDKVQAGDSDIWTLTLSA
ncbi:MAG: RNA polymerase sigma factor (sigma-70 family), partial [Planctomycetota bacterium]